MCGCSKSKKPQPARSIAPARVQPVQNIAKPTPNNITPVNDFAPMQMAQSFDVNMDKKLLQKMRQEAKLKALGRLF